MEDKTTSNVPARPRQAHRQRPRFRGTRSVWIGGLFLLLALGMILAGARATHRLTGGDEKNIPEGELVRAITLGGVTTAEPRLADGTTQSSESRPASNVQKTKNQDFCPT